MHWLKKTFKDFTKILCYMEKFQTYDVKPLNIWYFGLAINLSTLNHKLSNCETDKKGKSSNNKLARVSLCK